MKFSRAILVLFAACVSALPISAADPIYKNDFESAAVDKVPADVLIMAGSFEVKQDGTNKVLELPGEPLDTFGMLFGPSAKDDITATARFLRHEKGAQVPDFRAQLERRGRLPAASQPGEKHDRVHQGR